MRWKLGLILTLQAALVTLLAISISTGLLPLGIRGEWEWSLLKPTVHVPWGWLALSGLGVLAYAGFAGLGFRALSKRVTGGVEARWLAALLASAVAVQVVIPMGAADEYDLTKWAYVNYLSSSTGYFKIARDQAAQHPWEFMARYPEWIRSQDSLHIGTHPPGLIVAQCILIRTLERNPALTDFLIDFMPPSVQVGFRQLEGIDGHPIRRWERASLYATALSTLLACAGTVVPLYLLARAALPAPAAWAAAALWPLASAVNLFQPGADTTYPLLSTTAWALAAWASRSQHKIGRHKLMSLLLCTTSGVVMAFGMVFTLAFLPVGLITALIILLNHSLSIRLRAFLILATGAGYLAFVLGAWLVTGADPFVVWRWNLHHHARFYDEYPRTYWLWLWANPVELAIAIGLPTIVWCAAGLIAPRTVPRSFWATLLVLILVNLTGRNMGEVARLWMLFMPPFLVAAGNGLNRLGGGPITLAASTALVGLQTLALQSLIQVVYPV